MRNRSRAEKNHDLKKNKKSDFFNLNRIFSFKLDLLFELIKLF